MSAPHNTRLRYVKAKMEDEIELFLSSLPFRVQIYGCPVWTNKYWVLWFVPPDDLEKDVQSVDLTK